MASDPHWIEKATAKMKQKGTVGSFGKASPGKIKRGLAKGGASAKKALFAKNVAAPSKAATMSKQFMSAGEGY